MKKCLFFLFFALVSVNSVFSQFKIIPKIGYTNSGFSKHLLSAFEWTVTTPELEHTIHLGELDNAFNGLSLGVGMDMPLGKKISFQPEMMLFQRGLRSKSKTTTSINNSSYTRDLNVVLRASYLEVPLLIKFTFGKDKLKFFTYTGPSIGFLLNTKFKAEYHLKGADIDSKFSLDNSGLLADNQSRVNAGVHLGVGVSIAAGKGSILLETRYERNFTDFYKHNPSEPGTGTGNEKTGSDLAGIFVGYAIPL